jgi:hypothetical protein
LKTSKIVNVQAKSGIEIESTELALAFPLLPKTNLAAQVCLNVLCMLLSKMHFSELQVVIKISALKCNVAVWN